MIVVDILCSGLGIDIRMLKQTHLKLQAQHTPDRCVKGFLADFAVFYCFNELGKAIAAQVNINTSQ